jgi:hypothetical protein
VIEVETMKAYQFVEFQKPAELREVKVPFPSLAPERS